VICDIFGGDYAGDFGVPWYGLTVCGCGPSVTLDAGFQMQVPHGLEALQNSAGTRPAHCAARTSAGRGTRAACRSWRDVARIAFSVIPGLAAIAAPGMGGAGEARRNPASQPRRPPESLAGRYRGGYTQPVTSGPSPGELSAERLCPGQTRRLTRDVLISFSGIAPARNNGAAAFPVTMKPRHKFQRHRYDFCVVSPSRSPAGYLLRGPPASRELAGE
jgi:hypothetical protein